MRTSTSWLRAAASTLHYPNLVEAVNFPDPPAGPIADVGLAQLFADSDAHPVFTPPPYGAPPLKGEALKEKNDEIFK